MAFVIGIDEAGYGPNLGPLVIGGSLWYVPDANDSQTWSARHTRDRLKNAAIFDALQGTFDDSKRLYSRSGGLGRIEQPILSLLRCINDPVSHQTGTIDLFCMLTGERADFFETEPGYCWRDVAIPQSCDWYEIDALAKQIRQQLANDQTRCLSLSATMVFPRAWNKGLVREGNKASLLSALSCRLVKRLLQVVGEREPTAAQRAYVYCDKHGGRNHYAALLQHEMNCGFVTAHSESPGQSTYSWKDDSGRDIDIAFTARGESQTPVAVASMVAKYLRELAMAGWNIFWKREIPELQPTAGYPLDAKRFRKDIAHTRQKLHIPENSIWRLR